jgi:hypothetical protein
MVCDTFDRSEYGIKLAQATELRGDLQVSYRRDILPSIGTWQKNYELDQEQK